MEFQGIIEIFQGTAGDKDIQKFATDKSLAAVVIMGTVQLKRAASDDHYIDRSFGVIPNGSTGDLQGNVKVAESIYEALIQSAGEDNYIEHEKSFAMTGSHFYALRVFDVAYAKQDLTEVLPLIQRVIDA